MPAFAGMTARSFADVTPKLFAAFLLHLAHGGLRREAGAAARERVDAALRPGAIGRASRVGVPGRVPVAERIAVPGRLRGEPRQAELLPDGACLLHEIARRQRQG